jgi:hypothetical protein
VAKAAAAEIKAAMAIMAAHGTNNAYASTTDIAPAVMSQIVPMLNAFAAELILHLLCVA